MSESTSLQDRLAPQNACFGCGAANDKGLRIKSFAEGDSVVCEWTPQKHHEAFEGVLCGGIIGTIMDCHSNWTALWSMMKVSGSETAPCTVTAEYAVQMRRPTPTDGPVRLVARAVEGDATRAVVECELHAGDKLCATCRGTFVAVTPGHPAYHRW